MMIFLFFDCIWDWGCGAGAEGFMLALVMMTRSDTDNASATEEKLVQNEVVDTKEGTGIVQVIKDRQRKSRNRETRIVANENKISTMT